MPETKKQQQVSVTIRRTYAADRERVFRAWTDPVEMRKWLSPQELTTPQAEVDLVVGGRYRVVMEAPDGARHVATGVYREIRRPERLAFTWRWEGGMEGHDSEGVVIVDLRAAGAGTEVVLTHTGFPDAEAAGKHEQGWTSCLESLAHRGL